MTGAGTAPRTAGAPRVLRVGTRASLLALTQSETAARALVAGTGTEVELVRVRTHGDVDRRPLTSIGGTGVFVTAVRQALLDGEVDLIVHSCKDLPTAPADGIALACIPEREDPRDALVARDGLTLRDLPAGARVGTGSPRRAAQLLRARPDLEVIAIRGNIDTRLNRALGPAADLDAVVLAAAGLRRAGRGGDVTDLLDPDVMLPAPAQGALALECRAEDAQPGTWLGGLLAAYDHAPTRAAVTAERALLRALEAGCAAPVAAYAQVDDGPGRADDAAASDGSQASASLVLQALAISPDGRTVVDGSATAAVSYSKGADGARHAAALGERLAADLLSRGAAELLTAART